MVFVAVTNRQRHRLEPRYLVDWYLEGRLPPRVIDYRQGVTCRRVVSELTHLEDVFTGAPLGWPTPYPSFSNDPAENFCPMVSGDVL